MHGTPNLNRHLEIPHKVEAHPPQLLNCQPKQPEVRFQDPPEFHTE